MSEAHDPLCMQDMQIDGGCLGCDAAREARAEGRAQALEVLRELAREGRAELDDRESFNQESGERWDPSAKAFKMGAVKAYEKARQKVSEIR